MIRIQNLKSIADSTPWLSAGMQWKANKILDLLDSEISIFKAYCLPTEIEIELRRRVIVILEKLIKTKLSKWKAELTITGPSGLFLDDDPIEITILSPRFGNSDLIHLHTELFNLLITSEFIDKAELIESSPIPILKIVTASQFGGFPIHITIHSTYRIQETEAIEELLRGLKELKRARLVRLFYLVRVLLNSKGNHLTDEEQGGIGKVAIFCLVLSYLQLDRKLSTPLPAADLLGFLQHYTQVNLSKFTISVSQGRLIRNSRIQKESDAIYIQDFVNPTQNLTRSVTKSKFIIGTFQTTFDYLLPFATNSSTVDLFRLTTEKKSILSSIGIRLHQNFTKIRKLRNTLAEKGVYWSNGEEEDEEDDVPLAELIFRSKSVAFRGVRRLSVGNLKDLERQGSSMGNSRLSRQSVMF